MKSLSGCLRIVCFGFCLGSFVASDVSAATYANPTSGGRQFAAERSGKKTAVKGASKMPQEDLDAVAPITFEELRLFARDWLKYSRWLKKDGNEYKAVAYLGVSKSADYPAEVVKWMDRHGWAVDRFFLLERKFRATLSVIEQENKQQNLLKHLEDQIRQVDENKNMTSDERESMKKKYLNTMQSVRAATDAKAPVTPEEYDLIKLNRDALMRILNETPKT